MFAALAAAATLAAAPPAPVEPSARYTVVWSADSFPDADVEARLELHDGAVAMSDFWATFFEDPRGWAGFVRDVRAQTPDGSPLNVEEAEPYGWRIGDGYDGDVILTYTVDFSFADETWPAGNEQVALHDGDALFTTGLPLFAHAPSTTSARVDIVAPDGATVTTAWTKDGDAYAIPDLNRLLRNAIVVGDHYETRLEARNFELRIALLGDIAASGPMVSEAGGEILSYYVDLFRESEAAHFLMTVLPGPNDGEGYFNSFASSQPNAPSEADRQVWANSLAHEFLHYWNGKKFASTWENRKERQWFSEGFTEYFANRALRDLGMIDARSYDEILSQYLSFHAFFAVNPNYDDVTLRSAGTSKWINRPGVYDSGVAAAFCLDGLIREATDGERDLTDFMRAMNERFGRSGEPYVFDDLPAAASDVAGTDLSGFFETYVSGKTMLPVADCAARMDYVATVDGYHVILRRSEAANPDP